MKPDGDAPSVLRFLPVATGVSIMLTCVGTLVAAAWQSHVQGSLPYVSDAATFAPESCTFAELINLSNMLIIASFYIRYLQVSDLVARHPDLDPRVATMNHKAAWAGGISVFGFSLVANYQRSHMLLMHIFGGSMFFGAMVVYQILDARSSLFMRAYSGTPTMIYLRCVSAAISLLGLLSLSWTLGIAQGQFKGEDPNFWFPEDGGYYFHIASTSCEWITMFSLTLYPCTFYGEFSDLYFVRPGVVLRQKRQVGEVIALDTAGRTDTTNTCSYL